MQINGTPPFQSNFPTDDPNGLLPQLKVALRNNPEKAIEILTESLDRHLNLDSNDRVLLQKLLSSLLKDQMDEREIGNAMVLLRTFSQYNIEISSNDAGLLKKLLLCLIEISSDSDASILYDFLVRGRIDIEFEHVEGAYKKQMYQFIGKMTGNALRLGHAYGSLKQGHFHLASLHNAERILETLLGYANAADHLNKADAEGNTPLHYACLHGYKNIVRDLIYYAKMALRIQANNQGETPLHLVSGTIGAEILGQLVTDLKLDDQNIYGLGVNISNPFVHACKRGESEVAIKLYELVFQNSSDNEIKVKQLVGGFSEACHYNHLDLAKILYEKIKIENIEFEESDLPKALYYACIHGSLKTVRWLVESCRANLNHITHYSLFGALVGDQKIIALYLIEQDIDLINRNDLFEYVREKKADKEVVYKIIEKLAKSNSIDAETVVEVQSALDILVEFSNYTLAVSLLKNCSSFGGKCQPLSACRLLHHICKNKCQELDDLVVIDKLVPYFLQFKLLDYREAESESTLIHLAVQNPLALKCLIDNLTKYSDNLIEYLNQQQCDGKTALYLALEEKAMECAFFLIAKGAHLFIHDKEGKTAIDLDDKFLLRAVLKRHLLQKKEDFNLITKKRYQLLMHCQLEEEMENQSSISELIAGMSSEELNQTVYNNKTFLHIACKYHNHAVARELLLKEGILFHGLDDSNRSSVHWACTNAMAGIAQELIEKMNIDELNQCDLEGRTPLHLACRAGCEPIVIMLIKKGVNLCLVDNYKKLPMHEALDAKLPDAALQLMKEKIEAGDLEHYVTGAILAVENGFGDVAEKIIAKIIDAKIIDAKLAERETRCGQTLFELACYKEMPALVFLLEQTDPGCILRYKERLPAVIRSELWHCAVKQKSKASKNKNNDEVRRFEELKILLCPPISLISIPLHKALQKKQSTRSSLLMKVSGYVNKEDSRKRLPLHIASEKGPIEIFEMLQLESKENKNFNHLTSEDVFGKRPLNYAIEGRNRIIGGKIAKELGEGSIFFLSKLLVTAQSLQLFDHDLIGFEGVWRNVFTEEINWCIEFGNLHILQTFIAKAVKDEYFKNLLISAIDEEWDYFRDLMVYSGENFGENFFSNVKECSKRLPNGHSSDRNFTPFAKKPKIQIQNEPVKMPVVFSTGEKKSNNLSPSVNEQEEPSPFVFNKNVRNDHDQKPVSSEFSVKSKKSHVPVTIKHEPLMNGPIGLPNLNSVTCYMNASLQIIFNIPDICEKIKEKKEENDLTKILFSLLPEKRKLSAEASDGKLKLLLDAVFNNRDPTELLEGKNAQHDPCEFLRIIFRILEWLPLKTNTISFGNDTLPSHTPEQTNILSVGIQDTEEEIEFQDIIEGHLNLEDMSTSTSSQTIMQQIAECSSHLIVQLKRFNKLNMKLSTNIIFPQNEIVQIQLGNEELTPCKIVGFINHHGTFSNEGHYTSYVKMDVEGVEEWYYCNDSIITKKNPEMKSNSVYLIILEPLTNKKS